MPERIECHTVEIDGVPISVRGVGVPTEEDIAHLTEIARAAKGQVDKDQPHYGVIQELLAAVRLATRCIPDGPVDSGALGVRDGAEVKTRLKRASLAARFALDPAYKAKVAAELAKKPSTPPPAGLGGGQTKEDPPLSSTTDKD